MRRGRRRTFCTRLRRDPASQSRARRLPLLDQETHHRRSSRQPTLPLLWQSAVVIAGVLLFLALGRPPRKESPPRQSCDRTGARIRRAPLRHPPVSCENRRLDLPLSHRTPTSGSSPPRWRTGDAAHLQTAGRDGSRPPRKEEFLIDQGDFPPAAPQRGLICRSRSALQFRDPGGAARPLAPRSGPCRREGIAILFVVHVIALALRNRIALRHPARRVERGQLRGRLPELLGDRVSRGTRSPDGSLRAVRDLVAALGGADAMRRGAERAKGPARTRKREDRWRRSRSSSGSPGADIGSPAPSKSVRLRDQRAARDVQDLRAPALVAFHPPHRAVDDFPLDGLDDFLQVVGLAEDRRRSGPPRRAPRPVRARAPAPPGRATEPGPRRLPPGRPPRGTARRGPRAGAFPGRGRRRRRLPRGVRRSASERRSRSPNARFARPPGPSSKRCGGIAGCSRNVEARGRKPRRRDELSDRPFRRRKLAVERNPRTRWRALRGRHSPGTAGRPPGAEPGIRPPSLER